MPQFANILAKLKTYITNGHPVYVLLPEASNIGRQPLQMDHFPNVQVSVHVASGQTLQLKSGEPFFQSYLSVLSGHKIYFDVRPHTQIAWVDGILDNVSRNICGRFGSLYLLHPPEQKSELAAFKIIIEHFGPDPPLISTAPKPDWVATTAASLPGVADVRARIREIENRIRTENESLEIEQRNENQLTAWTNLLWLDGIPLQVKVREALQFLGVPAEGTSLTGHLGDLTADAPNMHFIFEVTGSSGSIGIEKGRQLMQWVIDSPDPTKAKGVLIANAFRNDPPDKRPPTPNHKIFVSEVEGLAHRFGLALLDVRELYRVVCIKLDGKSVDSSDIMLDLQSSGPVTFRAS